MKAGHGTIFLGCGFAAKYPLGGGNFSVPLQWMGGLRRLGHDAVWLEWFSGNGNPEADRRCIRSFRRRLKYYGFEGKFCLIHKGTEENLCDLENAEIHGMSKSELENRLAGPNVLLNLSYSIRPPFLQRFERRILCDLDPCEFAYWMNQMEMGQSFHHEFCTIGSNLGEDDCRMPQPPVQFRTFFPVVDTTLVQPSPKPVVPRFTTIGQWWWDGCVQIDGEYPDLSKKHAFAPYMTLPTRIPEAHMEMAMNLAEKEEAEREMIRSFGWNLAIPHKVARSPGHYYRYLASSLAEFTLPKKVESIWRSGWISDRAIAFLASGRPSISEEIGARKHLPEESGLLWFNNIEEAEERIREVLLDWDRISAISRKMALDIFDAPKVIAKILG